MRQLAHLLARLQSYEQDRCMEGDGSAWTYAQLLQEVRQWQSRFDKRRVERGSVIGLQADFSLSAAAVLLALFSRQAVVALIPRRSNVNELLAEANAQALLVVDSSGTYTWHPATQPSGHPLLDHLRAASDGGIVIFTSGSTGHPKAALHSVERFLRKFSKADRRFRTLAFLLFDHIAGLDTLFYTLASGGTLILTRRRDPHTILNLIHSHCVEVLPASPSFLRLLCVSMETAKSHLSSLKVITYGAEPMDRGTLDRLNTLFPGVQISQKYGSTEIGSPRTISRGNDSLWLRMHGDGVETKVIEGVLWVRSVGTILGYLNAPSPLDDDGWYCTGDLVDVDGEWIRFRGRAADTINVGGEKVAPTEVEHTILELDFVRDVVVTGEPHALMGHVVGARVSLIDAQMNAKEAAARIRSHCRQRLPPYKVPVRVEITAEHLVSERQKMQRR